jgi:hypothetical protein
MNDRRQILPVFDLSPLVAAGVNPIPAIKNATVGLTPASCREAVPETRFEYFQSKLVTCAAASIDGP